MIYDHIDKLIRYIEQQISLSGSAELRLTYLALSADILMEYCFGKSMRPNLLEEYDKAVEWSRITKVVVNLANIGKRLGWVISYAMKCPMWILKMLSPDIASVIKLRHVSSFCLQYRGVVLTRFLLVGPRI